MRRMMITLEYDGSRFHGWQVQPHARTVQGVLEEALLQTTGEYGRITGASRTDSGVHAQGQVACFDTASELHTGTILRALNYWLPRDVAVLGCCQAPVDFDPRRWARSKQYRYRILRSTERRPLREGYVVRVWCDLNVPAMQECAGMLLGEHDFTSFASEHTEVEGRVRHVLRSEFVPLDDELHYVIEANGFLYNMVRIIVGTLLEVGRGSMSVAEFADALRARDREATGPTAPARALTLVAVRYDDDPRVVDTGPQAR